MTTEISVSITGYSDGSKIAHLHINNQSVKIQIKQANEIVEKVGLQLKTDFGVPNGAKSYQAYK